ncbi:MAG: Fe-S cluster assembly ATPase SufC [Candidatus Parvarchaeota archaeon]|nr:Fe-S cluster assembly ATPase SufC [Candidatus Parvarchaeota archaeon]
MENTLDVEKLGVRIKDRRLLEGISLHAKTGEVHVIMGPNGSGKTTLARTILGDRRYELTDGMIKFNGEDITKLKPYERARLGLFVSFQEPIALQGVNVLNFLRASFEGVNSTKITMSELKSKLKDYIELTGLPASIFDRNVNEGFSGGEKKRFELLQLLVIRPKIAILDEIDTGLDIEAMERFSKIINDSLAETGFIIITHNDRILRHIKPTLIHLMSEGRITKTGGVELIDAIEKGGYRMD